MLISCMKVMKTPLGQGLVWKQLMHLSLGKPIFGSHLWGKENCLIVVPCLLNNEPQLACIFAFALFSQ